ncbi:MAG: co-chaperone GroES family protein [Cytophagales bacterium]
MISEKSTVKDLIVVGDKVLIKPKSQNEKTSSGLFLPPGVQEKEKIQYGYIIKVGPGYPIPMPQEDESWKDEKVKYLPLQAQVGDLAIYLQNNSFEIVYNKEKYVIVPQSSILLLERDPNLFE